MRKNALIAALIIMPLFLFIGSSVAGEIRYGDQLVNGAPLNGAVVDGWSYITFVPSESENVEKVEFYLDEDDEPTYTANSSPFIFTGTKWNTSLVDYGNHTITAKVYYMNNDQLTLLETASADFSRVGDVDISVITDAHICAPGFAIPPITISFDNPLLALLGIDLPEVKIPALSGAECAYEYQHEMKRDNLQMAMDHTRTGDFDFVASLGDNIEDLYPPCLDPHTHLINLINDVIDDYQPGIVDLLDDLQEYADVFDWIPGRLLPVPKIINAVQDVLDFFGGISLGCDPIQSYFDNITELPNVQQWLLLGNHDTRAFSEVTNETVQDLAKKAFQYTLDETSNPNSPVNFVAEKGKTSNNGWTFLFLNSSQAALTKKQGSCAKFDQDQLDYLDQELDQLHAKTAILFWHHDPSGELNGNNDGIGTSVDCNIRQDGEDLDGNGLDDDVINDYIDVLWKHRTKIKAVIAGHTHKFTRYKWDASFKAIHAVTDLSGSTDFDGFLDEKDEILFMSVQSVGQPHKTENDLWMDVELRSDGGLYVNDGNIEWNKVNSPGIDYDAFEIENQDANEGTEVSVTVTFSDLVPGTWYLYSFDWKHIHTDDIVHTFSQAFSLADDATVTTSTKTDSYTFPDDHPTSGTEEDMFHVQVTLTYDSENSVTGLSPIIGVNNLAPIAAVDTVTQENIPFLLPLAPTSFTGSFTDPGYPDTHTGLWNFGDGTNIAGEVVEENNEPDSTGTVTVLHQFTEPGDYTVTLTVTDDDGGAGTASETLKVLSATEAAETIQTFILDCPDDVFSRHSRIRRGFLRWELTTVRAHINSGMYQSAINWLYNIRSKADGQNNDWITDADTQDEIINMIDALIAYLQKL